MVSQSQKPGKIASGVQDFVALPLRIPPTPSYKQSPLHYLYVRANAPKIPTADTPRELFLLNLPIDATETHLRNLFSGKLTGGRVESIVFESTRARRGISAPPGASKGKKRKRHGQEREHDGTEEAATPDVGALPDLWHRDLHTSGSSAVVKFVDMASAELTLKAIRRAVKHGQELNWDAGPHARLPALGSERYLAHHQLRFPDTNDLQQRIDEFMEAFTAHEAARTKILARQRSMPDEDGFITVTRGGRNGPARDEDARLKEEELKLREKNRVMDDFYRFQTREKKKEVAKDLVRAFEEDAKKVEQMRKKRNKFRPE